MYVRSFNGKQNSRWWITGILKFSFFFFLWSQSGQRWFRPPWGEILINTNKYSESITIQCWNKAVRFNLSIPLLKFLSHWMCSRTNKNFSSLADELQHNSLFRNISMVSFLSLPYQRITRMPLLMEAVAKRVQIGDDGYQDVQYCLEVLKMVCGTIFGLNFTIAVFCYKMYNMSLLIYFVWNYHEYTIDYILYSSTGCR